MSGRGLFIAVFLLCLYSSVGVLPASAQSRSDVEVIIQTPLNDVAMDMALDSEGNAVVVGRSQTASITYTYGSKFHAVKVSPDGEVLWSRSWNVSSSDTLVSVAVDSLDNILLSGVCNLTSGNVSGILCKLNPAGAPVWSVHIPDIYFNRWELGISDSWPHLGIQMIPESDDFIVVGSILESSHKTIVARYNASGSMMWCTKWYGPAESLGSLAMLSWLSSQDWVIVHGWLYGDSIERSDIDGQFIAAFDFNGNLIWNYTSYDYSVDYCLVCFEINSDEYVCGDRTTGGMGHIACRTYDLNETWSFDVNVESPLVLTIGGFLANETDNLIGYGEVTSLIPEQAVTKSYRPKFQSMQPPQVCVFSFSSNGELLWYDYLVIGRITDPCGCQFDSNRRLAVAGHTSTWSFNAHDIFVVFGFVQTPFPVHYDGLALFAFPVLNLLALGTSWRMEQSSAGLSIGQRIPALSRLKYRDTVRLLLKLEGIALAGLFPILYGFVNPGFPAPIVFFPAWISWLLNGLLCGVLLLAAIHAVIWYRKR